MAGPYTLTATLNTTGSAALQGNAFIRVRLRNFAGFVPRVAGTAIVAETQIDAFPDVNGLVTQLLWGNSDLTPNTTFYTIEVWTAGRITSSGNYLITANTNLGTAGQVNTPPVPPGFNFVLQTNEVLNGSQTLLDLHAGTGVTLVDNGLGQVTITAGGFSGGSNVVSIPPYPSASGGLNGFTVVLKIPAGMVQAFTTAGFRVGIQTTAVTGLVVNASTIGKTLPGQTAWTNGPTAFTWPGGSFAVANTLYLSNVCALAGDTSHDFYVMVYFDPASASGNAYATNSLVGDSSTLIYTGIAGWKSGNHTADADASTFASLSGAALLCFAQILTA